MMAHRFDTEIITDDDRLQIFHRLIQMGDLWGTIRRSYPEKGLTEKIIGAAFRVHNRLGHSFLEKVYENALVNELRVMGVAVDQQKPLKVNYSGEPVGDFVVDLLVEGRIIVEIKAVKSLKRSFEEKLVHYLKVSGIRIGLLINFGRSVQIKRKIYG